MQKFNTLQRSLLQISAHEMSLVKCVAGKESKNKGRPLPAEENDFKKLDLFSILIASVYNVTPYNL